MVDVIVPGPAFQRKTDPTAIGSGADIDFTPAFQLGQRLKSVSTSHTTSGGAAI
jgi:hypothetical protein